MLNFFITKNKDLKTPFGQSAANIQDLEQFKDTLTELETASPFVCHDGQFLRFAPPSRYTSDFEARFLVEKGIIGELDMKVFFILNQLEFATSRQIIAMLAFEGIDIKPQKLKHILHRAAEKSFIHRIEFCFPKGTIQGTRAYTLHYHGVQFLRASGVRTRSIKYYQSLNIVDIKRQLAANQLLISMPSRAQNDFRFRSILVNEACKDQIVRVNALLQHQSDTYLVEVIRQYEDWQENFVRKLERYRSVLKNHRNLNTPFKKMPVLIIMAEDKNHMKQLQRLVSQNSYKKLPILYTYDKLFYVQADNLFYQGVA